VAADWFEVTNTTGQAIDITGWKIDDNSGSQAAAVALSGITSIAAGESVIFLETADLATTRASFIATWFGGNAPAGRLSPLAAALGGSLPAIVWDGVTKYGDKTEEVRIAVREKPEVGFINLGLGVTPIDLTKAKPSTARLPDADIPEPPAIVLPQDKPAAAKEGA
jgi:hypothetical protein